MQYRSNALFPTPSHTQAVADLESTQNPYAGSNQADVFRAAQRANALDLSRYAQQQQDAYEQAAGSAQRESALAGLSMLSQAQDNARGAQNSRLQMLLGGLL